MLLHIQVLSFDR